MDHRENGPRNKGHTDNRREQTRSRNDKGRKSQGSFLGAHQTGERKEQMQHHQRVERSADKQERAQPKRQGPHQERRQGGGNHGGRQSAKDFYRSKPQEVLPVYDNLDEIPEPGAQDLLFLPIGGSGEIGMNVNLYGHNNQWIMVDLGITFSDEPYGYDLVTANLDIVKNSSLGRLLKGVIITHAHEDHIGGVHEIWPYYKFHVYVTKFAKEILIRKLEDKPYADELIQYYLHEVPSHGHIKVGDFDIQYLDITHSIPESNALLIKTPVGSIFHTGDWKLDPNPGMGEPTNEERYRSLAKEKIVAMVCDSTNAMSKGRSGSEEQVADAFDKLFQNRRKNRIAVTCFASNVGRVKVIADLAQKYGRKVCLLGRSLHKMVEAADQCQFPIHADRFISDLKAAQLPKHQVLYICTGSQGDLNAALMKISRNLHRLKLSEGDAVFFSSKAIPGNERRINLLQNNLTRLGVDIFTERDATIHVSGHPNQEELKEMYSWVKPDCVVPVHGEIRHLYEHAKFARRCGFEAVVPENGTLIDLKKQVVLKRYGVGRMVLDGNRFINFESSIIKERRLLGSDGVVFVSINGKYVQVSSHGLIDGSPEEFKKRLVDGIRKQLNTNAELIKSVTMRDARIVDYVKTVMRSMYSKTPEVKIHWLGAGEGANRRDAERNDRDEDTEERVREPREEGLRNDNRRHHHRRPQGKREQN